LIQIAENIGWRTAFYIAGIPGLLIGVITVFYLRKSTTVSRGNKSHNGFNVKELWQYNNIKWGTLLACCVFGWWFATIPFITKYFTDVQGMDAGTMQKTMGLLGVAMLISSLFFPGISDKIGRKKALLIALSLGVFYPFAVYFLNGSGAHLPVMFVTYAMVGTIPLVAAIVPSEAVPNRLKAKAIGFVTAVAEIVGGVLVPAIAGGLSDAINESAFLWIATALAVLSLFFLSKLEETKGTVVE
jgi:predicted MFS family arabinose efflux permease